MSTTTGLTLDVTVGEYRVQMGRDIDLRCLRYGEPWRDCGGDNLICALAHEVARLRAEIVDCRRHNKVPTMPNCHVCGKLLEPESQENLCDVCRR